MKKRSIFLSISLALMILLSACAKPASPADQTPAANTGEQVLLVWDQFYRDEESKVMETLNAEFEAAHPGVKIQREVKVLADLQTTVKLALANADGPDVAQVNQGRNDMGALVEAGLLLPLNPYLEKYNWSSVFSTSVASRNSFTEDGKTFGTGNLYGVSPTAEVVGVFYNKDIFKKNRWDVPTTFEDFEALLAKIKTEGITPISFGSLDGWNAIHEYSAIQHLLVSLDYINNLTYGVNNVSFDIPENRQAAQILQDWAKAGYFTEGFPGIGYDDCNNLFKAGNGAMTITGSWLAPELMVGTDQEFGFFLLPPFAGKTGLAIGGVGIPFAIRKTTEKQDLAAEYLNWMISPRAAELWAEAGMLPAMALPEDSKVDTNNLFGDTLNAWNAINKENAVGHYIDWATPTFYDTLVAELQKLLGGISTPANFTEAVEADYKAYLQSKSE
ncbi:MAG TPA: extracellular solute-binding protein [Anaerolineaceae bacterium]|nr:extracellular solute-binding protein [Anaerolineaceae bacterium]HQJ32677.1 extracellular solute-binding protein [Anaerolineaceae bacterium]